MAYLFLIIVTLSCWVLFYLAFSRDRSRYRNAYLLFIALCSTLVTLVFLAGPYMVQMAFFVMFAILIAILIVPFFLVCNGIVMIRKEGHGLADLLSLLFGILIGIGEIATLLSIFSVPFDRESQGIQGLLASSSEFLAFIGTSVIYVSMSFLIFMIYTLFLQIVPRKRDFDYVIIHGSGLIDGDKVPRLLSDRIDKALEVYHKDPTPPILIPSGGQGGNETVPEAKAMGDYIISRGIPEDRVILEDGSTTTYENLVNSKAIIDAGKSDGYIALVTSNYHVYRALRYCKKIGLKCTGIGSHVAFYYWPSALIREYIAVHAEMKHLIIFILGWLFFMMPFLINWLF